MNQSVSQPDLLRVALVEDDEEVRYSAVVEKSAAPQEILDRLSEATKQLH